MSENDDMPGPDVRQYAMLTHLSALLGFVIPFGSIIAPLVMWQARKTDEFIDDQGKEALNFQITVAIAAIVCFLLTFVLIGLLLLPIVAIGALVLIVIAGLKANEGERYRYPFVWRIID
jgi:uncharacterized Tic20 family protein